MEEITLLRDLAVIMVMAGTVTLIFRQLKQPVILGYLIAGLIIGPYTPPFAFVSNVQTVNMMADMGIVLLLFAMGLEFSWTKIRQVGSSVILIGLIEIVTMISLGYAIGRLLGWSEIDALFLGATLHISSSAIIVKALRDAGRLNFISSRLIVGILVVEDFAAVAILAILSQVANTGVADFGDVGIIILRLVIFVLVSLIIGRWAVPRLLKMINQLASKEVLLITSLGLCFALALLGNYLGLSIAAGAFIMGAIIGDTEFSKEITAVVSPVRDMFAAIFFVSIGMLIDITQIRDFIIPALVVYAIYLLGKIFANMVATFICGNDGRTSLNVGMGMPQMGEFSLIIAKTGVDRGLVISPLYHVTALVTGFTSLTSPYILRSSQRVANFLESRAPQLLKTYISRMGDWLKALREASSSDTVAAHITQHAARTIVINIFIVLVLTSAGTYTLRFAASLSELSGIRIDLIGLLLSLVLLALCLPSFFSIWRNLRNIARMLSGLWLNRTLPGRTSRISRLPIILSNSMAILLLGLVFIWFIPYLLGLFHIGSYALLVPLLLAVIAIYLVLHLAFDIHGQLERAFSQAILGREHVSPSSKAKLSKRRRQKSKESSLKTDEVLQDLGEGAELEDK